MIKTDPLPSVKIIILYSNGSEKIIEFKCPTMIQIDQIDNSDNGPFDRFEHDFYVSGYFL